MTATVPYEVFWDGIAQFDETAIQSNEHFLRPENRSSTIFPIFKDSSTKTSIQFLSYWLKKHGNNVVARFTVRDSEGQLLVKKYEIITACRAHSVQVSDYFPIAENGFCGSVEVEIFSKKPPLYTFPAVTVCYEGDGSCSVVHACIRTYNKGEAVSDYALMLPQTGFDVELSEKNKNFICFFGGELKTYNINIELMEGDCVKKYPLKIDNHIYGQMHLIWLEHILHNNDADLFKNPKCLIHHDLTDVYPRFYVGISKEYFAPTMTHTFFDTSKVEETSRAKTLNLRANNPDPINYFDAAFSIPIFPSNSLNTALRTYSQNLYFSGTSVVSLYTLEGDLIYSRNLTQQEVTQMCGVGTLELSEVLQQASSDPNKCYCVRFAFVNEKSPFPRRFKLGLNIKRKENDYGSNICFAPLVVSESTLSKPFNRRWFPVGGKQNYVATFHNTSLDRMKFNEIAECNFEFFNHQGETFSRCIDVPKNGSVFLDAQQDKELKTFLGSDGGWCMVTSNTYLCDAYFFSFADEQIGGDHAY